MELLLIASLLAVLGFWLLLRGLRQLFKRKPIRGMLLTSTGCCGTLAGALLLALGANLASYERLTYERELAQLSFYQIAPQHFMMAFRNLEDGTGIEIPIAGDEWQVDARVLKWHPWANLVGLDSQYKWERISGRYRNTEQARNSLPSLHPLSSEPGLDFWSLSRQQAWLGYLVDTSYGSAAYMPMADGASYSLSLTQSGLVARPTNAAAQQAVRAWR